MAKKKVLSSRASITNIRNDAKTTQRTYNSMWSVTKHAPLFLRRPKMVGSGKNKKRATYKNKKGEEVPIPQKMNRCVRRFPIRVLLSAGAANAADTLAAEAKMMRSEVTGEANVSGALPDVSKGAELALEHALVSYAQTAFRNALAIRDAFGMHKKVTAGSMQAAVKILNEQINSSTNISPGTFLVNKHRMKTRSSKKAGDAKPEAEAAAATAEA